MAEYFVVEKSTGKIVNCINAQRKPDLAKHFEHPDLYELTTKPSQARLEAYEFYWNRP